MKLKSFGCSFIFGSDLADDGRDQPFATASKFTWPALLAQDLQMQYECYARPGSGNLRILEKVLSVATQEPAVFVIGWTWIDRFDYVVDFANQRHNIHDLADECNLWRTMMPQDRSANSDFYFRQLHNQYRDKLSSLIYIKTAIDTLTQKNLPFIMTYMDELLFETEWHASSAVTDLQTSIRPYMTKFEDKTFLEFAKVHNFPISETLHPLEPAHQAGFELIKSYNLV
jgi:hypothetical protein